MSEQKPMNKADVILSVLSLSQRVKLIAALILITVGTIIIGITAGWWAALGVAVFGWGSNLEQSVKLTTAIVKSKFE